jgi:hypothetical protein
MERDHFFSFCDGLKLSKYDLEHLVGTQRWDNERAFRQVDGSFKARFGYDFIKVQFNEDQIRTLKKNRSSLVDYYSSRVYSIKCSQSIIEGCEYNWIDNSPDIYLPSIVSFPLISDLKIPVASTDLECMQRFSLEYSRFKSLRDSNFDVPFPHFWHQLTYIVTQYDVLQFAGQFNLESRSYFSRECGVLCPFSLFDGTGHVLSICNIRALVLIYNNIRHTEFCSAVCEHSLCICPKCALKFSDVEMGEFGITAIHTFKNKIIVVKSDQFCEIEITDDDFVQLKNKIICPSKLFNKRMESICVKSVQLCEPKYCNVAPDVSQICKLNVYQSNVLMSAEMWFSKKILEVAMLDIERLGLVSRFRDRKFGNIFDFWFEIKNNPVYLSALRLLHSLKHVPFYLTRSGKVKSNLTLLEKNEWLLKGVNLYKTFSVHQLLGIFLPNLKYSDSSYFSDVITSPFFFI